MEKKYGYKVLEDVSREDKLSKEEVWKLWSDPTAFSKNGIATNAPKNYTVYVERSRYLVNLLSGYLDSKSSILELGCNVGRNLDCFLRSGYLNLSGVEISKPAISLMKTTYPELHSTVDIFNEPIESCITQMPEGSYDCIYTMAVLEHVHYSSEFIFDEIKRVAKKYIVTIEDEKTTWSNRHFPRNYEAIFSDENWQQVYSIGCEDIGILDDRFIIRVFNNKTNI